MPDPVPNPIAAQVIAPAPPPPPQIQQPAGAPDQIAPVPTQQYQPANLAQAALGGGAPPQPTPQQKDLAHSTVIGHGFKSLMSMLAPQNPDTPVSPTRRFFSSILSGAIAGGAAGAGSGDRTAGSGWGAAGIGAGAAQKQQQQQALLAQQQKQQQFENNMKMDEAEQQRIRNQAEIAMWHATGVREQQRLDFEGQDRIDKRNDANRAIIDTIQKNGGQDPTDLNPVMNIYDLRDKVIATKGAALHPQGDPTEKNSHRIFVDTVSGDTEKFDPDKNVWVDEVTGQPMDKTAKTNIRIFDVPIDAMNQRVTVPKAVMNKISGGVLFKGATDGDVTLTLGQALGVGTTYRAQEGQSRSDELATNTLNEAKFRDFFEMTKTENDGLIKQQTELQPTDPQYKALQKQIDDNNQQLTDQYFKIHPDSKKTADDLLKSPPPPPADTPSTLLLGKMKQDDQVQPGTPEAYQYITASSLKPEDQQAALRDSNTPMPWIQATKAADQLIAQTPMSREAALRKIIQQARAHGITVAPRPNNGTVFSPYPDLSSSNVTTQAPK